MKKRLLYILILPFCLLVINSCKKNPLPPEQNSGEPVFYFKCDELGRFDAGVKDYYMQSSHEQNGDSVYVYVADLKQRNCSGDCGYSIKILINDFKVSVKDAPMKPDSGLVAGNYEFNDGNLPPWGYDGTFTSFMTILPTFTWTYSDGISSITNLASESHFFKAGNTSSVTLSVDKQGDIRTLTNVYEIGNPLQTNINVKWTGAKTYSFSATSTIPIDSYSWDFGDGSLTLNSASPTHEYSFTGDFNYYTATLTATSGSNTSISRYQVAASQTNVFMNQANFTNSFTPVANTKKLSTVTILLIDHKTGKIYSCENLDQGNDKFEIVSVEDYKFNDAQHATKKLKIKFNCALKNDSATINLTNGDAVIAVSYR